jgi:uncharacterized membrane protein
MSGKIKAALVVLGLSAVVVLAIYTLPDSSNGKAEVAKNRETDTTERADRIRTRTRRTTLKEVVVNDTVTCVVLYDLDRPVSLECIGTPTPNES